MLGQRCSLKSSAASLHSLRYRAMLVFSSGILNLILYTLFRCSLVLSIFYVEAVGCSSGSCPKAPAQSAVELL